MKRGIIICFLVVLAGGGGFIAGIKYQQRKIPFRGNFPERGMSGQKAFNGLRSSGANLVRGKVVGKDETGLTVKLADESSKLVFLTAETKIYKAEEGQPDDLEVGQDVLVFGRANDDGSVSASTIQLDSGLGMSPPAGP